MDRRLAVLLATIFYLTTFGFDFACAQEAVFSDQSPNESAIDALREEVIQLRRQVQGRTRPPTDLLPPPIDANRLLPSVVRAADYRGAFYLPGTEVYLRIDGYARCDVMYDTGFVGTGIQLFPTTIALDGTRSEVAIDPPPRLALFAVSPSTAYFGEGEIVFLYIFPSFMISARLFSGLAKIRMSSSGSPLIRSKSARAPSSITPIFP